MVAGVALAPQPKMPSAAAVWVLGAEAREVGTPVAGEGVVELG